MFIIPKGTVDYYLYFLRLKHNYFYVGITNDIKRRLWQHLHNKGSVVTQIHYPIKLEGVWYLGAMSYGDASIIEDEFTIYFMSVYGDKVRGGRWCKRKENVKKILKKNPIYNPCECYHLIEYDIKL